MNQRISLLVLSLIFSSSSCASFQHHGPGVQRGVAGAAGLPSTSQSSQRKRKESSMTSPYRSSAPVRTVRTETKCSAFAPVVAIDAFFKTQPFLSAFMMGSLKASAADLVVQTTTASSDTEKGKNHENEGTISINANRNLAFLLYGGLYQGMFLQFLYTTVYPAIFQGKRFLLVQVATDIGLVGPLLTLPVAYVLRSFIESKTETAAVESNTVSSSPFSFFRTGLQKYVHHITSQKLLLRYWSIWGPAQCLTFGVVPEHWRVPFVAAVSFFWMALLSAISSRGGGVKEHKPKRICSNTLRRGTRTRTPYPRAM